MAARYRDGTAGPRLPARGLAALALLAALLCTENLAAAATKTWADGSGDWNISGNWSPSGQPQAGDDVRLTQTDSTSRTVGYDNTTNPSATLNSLTIDGYLAGTMTLDLSSGDALNVTTEYVGYSRRGAVTQHDGVVSTDTAYLGYSGPSANGTVTVDGSGSVWNNTGSLYVGGSSSAAAGSGFLTVSNGAFLEVGGDLKLWDRGHLTIQSGATVTAGSISKAATAQFTWTAGTLGIQGAGGVSIGTTGSLGATLTLDGTKTLDVTDTTTVAAGGTLTLSGGALVTGTLARSGGLFNWSSGTLDITGAGGLTVSPGPLGALLTLSAGKTLDVANTMTISSGATLTLSGGSLTTGALNRSGAQLNWSSGTLSITGAGGLTVGSTGSLGASPTLSGGKTLNVTNMTTVADEGLLTLSGGALATGALTDLGRITLTSGALTVQGGASTVAGRGELTVSGGALTIQGGTLSLADFGVLTVSGGALTVQGGTLSVAAGGVLDLSGGTLAVDALTDSGTINVTDGTPTVQAGAWTVASGGALTVSGGALTIPDGTLTVAAGGTLTLSGGALTTHSLTSAGTLQLANGALTVQGGTFTAGGGGLVLDASALGNNPKLVLDHATLGGTQGIVVVGDFLQGTLEIRGGTGLSVSGPGYIGRDQYSSGAVTVTGAGSAWTSSGDLYVGKTGIGTLNVQAGGQVANTDGLIGYGSGSSGAVTVTGAGSAWTNSGKLYVGKTGTGTLNVQASGQVANTNGYIGYDSGSSGTVTVADAGSTWTNDGELYVGYSGNGTLNIQAGGQVSSRYVHIGYDWGSIGTVSVTGTTWACSGGFCVGERGTGALNIQAGGQVSTGEAHIGQSDFSGTVTVTGTGSAWTSSGILYVGDSGTGTVNVQAGGQVVSTGGCIGYDSGSSGTVTVSGPGSAWTSSGYLCVGESGALNIQAGGQVASNGGSIACSSGSSGAVTVTGAGSAWTTNGSSLSIGSGTLNVQAGGHVASGAAHIGGDPNFFLTGTGAVTVAGTGSTWTIAGELRVGTHVGNGTLNIQEGGQVSNTAAWVGMGRDSTGTVTVDGCGSAWNCTNWLWIANGSVTVQNGGQLTAKVLALLSGPPLGGLAIRDGGVVTADDLDGNGEPFTWTTGVLSITGERGFEIGATGPLGPSLVLDTGKTLRVTNTTTIDADGTLALSAGGLTTGSLHRHSGGTINWTRGTLGITGADGLTVGLGNFFETSLTLGPGQTLNVTRTLIVACGATLTVNGGSLTAGALTNDGTLMLALDDTVPLAAPIFNTGSVEFAVAAGSCPFDSALAGAGTFTKSGDGTLLVAGPQDYDPGALFDVRGGTVVFQTDAGAGGANLDVSVTGAELDFACDQHLDRLAVDDSIALVFAPGTRVVVNHYVLAGTDLGPAILTPEPATLALLTLGGLCVLVRRRHRATVQDSKFKVQS